MEKFNPQKYRDNIAKDLKEIRKTDPEQAQTVLAQAEETEEYQESLDWHLTEKKLEKINLDHLLNELSLKRVEVPIDAKSLESLSIGSNELFEFVVGKYKKQYPNLFFSSDDHRVSNEKVDNKIFSLIEKELSESKEKAPKGWLNFGFSQTKHFMEIINKLAQKQPNEFRMYHITSEKDLRNPHGTSVGDYIPYYSPKIIQETKEIIDSKKFIKNKENWLTKYGAMQALNIPLEKMNAYIIEYQKKEPDFIIGNELTGQTFLYKALIKEIKERIANGESEKIIPEDWQTVQEFADGTLLNMKLDSPADVLNYLLENDPEIYKILNSHIDYLNKVNQNSDMVIKKGKERYWSPAFFEIIKNKIFELEKVELPNEAKEIYFFKQYWYDFASTHDIDKLEAARVYSILKKEFKDKIIPKIMDTGQFIGFYPSEFKEELEKRILKLKKRE